MDEAQKELEKNAVHRPDDDEDDDEAYDGPRASNGDAERRSVRSEDRDLLEGADAEAMSIRGQEGVSAEVKPQTALSPTTPNAERSRRSSGASSKVIEFER
jgi:hypothetical protein